MIVFSDRKGQSEFYKGSGRILKEEEILNVFNLLKKKRRSIFNVWRPCYRQKNARKYLDGIFKKLKLKLEIF